MHQLMAEWSDTTLSCTQPSTNFLCFLAEVTMHGQIILDHSTKSKNSKRLRGFMWGIPRYIFFTPRWYMLYKITY